MMLGGLRLERARASSQFREGAFHNTFAAKSGLAGPKLPVLKELLLGRGKRKPPGAIPVGNPLEGWARPISSSKLRVTWLGHSTCLLELDGLRVLTDPVFGSRIGPTSWLGPKRLHAAPVTVEQLPKLDAVLVSHDHFDHLCRPTIEAIAKLDVPVITSLGVGHHLEAFGVAPERIVELDWWEQHALPGGTLQFSAVPAQHFSGRMRSRNTTLWSSWVIESEQRKVFFSGDTGLTPEMADVHAKFGTFDLVMLEIGAWHPAWGTIHLGPDGALEAFSRLGGGTLLPIHWATFDLGLHPWAEPAETLWTRAEATGQRILTPRLGVPFEPTLVDQAQPWWRSVVQRGVI
jgi:L-ascorbate metabolism protein UlaG (beta-lactamase superfamily)